METHFLIAIGLTLIFSGFLKGFSGFGMSLILVGISLTFYDPKFIIPVLALLSITMNILLLIEHRKSIVNAKLNFAFRPETLVSLLIGTTIGTFSLLYLDSNHIKLFLGIMTLIFVFLIVKKIELKKKLSISSFWKNVILGNVTGFFSGMLNINGPPVVIYNLYTNKKKADFINSIIIFFTIADVFAIITYFLKDLFTLQSFVTYLQFLPLVVLGLLAGRLLRLRVEDTKFRKYILIILFVVALKLIFEGLKYL